MSIHSQRQENLEQRTAPIRTQNPSGYPKDMSLNILQSRINLEDVTAANTGSS